MMAAVNVSGFTTSDQLVGFAVIGGMIAILAWRARKSPLTLAACAAVVFWFARGIGH